MELERRGRVKRSHDRGNWEQEDFDACDRHAVRLACLLDGSRVSLEVHVRFCERPAVQSRRPTHPGSRRFLARLSGTCADRGVGRLEITFFLNDCASHKNPRGITRTRVPL
jgi:hypothetical protein